jgi:hypothetical protein
MEKEEGMRRLLLCLTMAVLAMAASPPARAATEVRMTGDALVYGNFFANRNFTGWNNAYWTSETPTIVGAGNRTADTFEIWERFRLRTDFIANEAVKFRLGLAVEDTWGHGTLTAANPSAAVEVYQAYLQFALPGTDIQFTAGLQPAAIPQSSFFAGSLVFDEDVCGAVLTAPLIKDTLTLVLGYVRTISSDRTYAPTTKAIYSNEEGFLLALPVTLPGFKATPWALLGFGGPGGHYFTEAGWAEGLISGGILTIPPYGWKNNFVYAPWVGTTLEITALDPLKFYADVIWGEHGSNEYRKNVRHGWFVDAAAEYTGFSVLTPQVFGFWSTGEDGSTRNGSERMPNFFPGTGRGAEHNGGTQSWNAGNSFLFDGGQELVKGSNLGLSPVGNMGGGVSLNNIALLDRLTQRVTFAYVRGNNSPRAFRFANAVLGSNPIFVMGRDLTWNEWIIGLNFDSRYMLYDNLALILETGWAHAGGFQSSVWGHRLASRTADPWKVAFGLKYTF